MNLPLILSLVVALAILTRTTIDACSNIIVSGGASTDSSNILAYNADSSALYGSLYHYPAGDHAVGAMRDVYDWDSGRYLGQIKEARHTYNVVGNMNEFGLTIGETTYGGIAQLQSQSAAKMDYGSAIWVTLQRSKNAREAISTLGSLLKEYGWASEGESFSIIDNNEAWVMEIIGKGEFELGAVWVAMKVPDGYVSAHANQARITTFPLNDKDNCIYSSDVVSFAKKIGLYPESKADSEFSFSDIYDPVTFSGARYCEARVWSFFGQIMGSEWAAQYQDYAMGYNLTNRMPLFVKPALGKISVSDTMQYMRNHFEGTALDMAGVTFPDVGAVFSATPVRSHPLSWTSKVAPDGSRSTDTSYSYFNERPIATQQTGWNFVAQSRRWMPPQLSGLLWFGVDDSSTTVHFPIYGSATSVPSSFAGKGPQDGVTTPMMTFDMKSAFYAFNVVANWAYTRWDLMYPELYQEIVSREAAYMSAVLEIDSNALKIIDEKGMDSAVEYITNFSTNVGNDLVDQWGKLFGKMFVKYRDGYVIKANSESKSCGCAPGNGAYPQTWYDRIVEETGSHYYLGSWPEGSALKKKTSLAADNKFNSVDKLSLLNRR